MPVCSCGKYFFTEHGINIHLGKGGHIKRAGVDLIKLGVMKRKLTRKESAKITKEVMDMELKSSEARFIIAIVKSIQEVSANSSQQ